MPHLVYEITNNLDTAKADIPGLLKKSNQVLIAQGGVFPIGASAPASSGSGTIASPTAASPTTPSSMPR